MSFETFLDTTPRQWLQKIPKARLPFTTVFSVVLHLSAFIALVLAPQSKILTAQENSDVSTLENVEVEMTSSDEVEPVYDDTSGIVVPVEKMKKALTEAQKLFNKYKNIGVATKATPTKEVSARAGFQKIKPQNIPLEAVNKQPQDKDQVTQYLSRYQHQFQSCYDSALLKDSSLNGRVRFSLRVSKAGSIAESSVRFDGVGQNTIRHNLESCLQVATHQIQFPQNMSEAFNREIQFQAVLSL